MSFSYVVRCAFARRESMEGFLAWLRDPHIAEVRRAGADSAFIVVLDPAAAAASVPNTAIDDDHPHVLEARYTFASRDAFERYERDEAPRLRAEGLAELARLGLATSGVKMTRTTGEIVLISRSRLAEV